MPQVPTYERQVQLRPTAPPQLNSPRQPAIDSRMGQALERVGSSLMDIGLAEQKKADDAQTLEADRKLLQWELDTVDDPQKGVMRRQGKDALSIPDEVFPAYDKYRSEIESSLNPRVRDRFRVLAEDRKASLQKRVWSHVSKQSDAILESEFEASVATGLNAVGLATRDGDMARAQRETDRIMLAAGLQMDRRGLGPEARKAEFQKLTAAAKGTMLEQMLGQRRYREAIEFYRSNVDDFGEKAPEYARQIREAEYAIAETDAYDRIVASVGPGEAGMAEARRIEDPILRERVEHRLDAEQLRRQRIDEQRLKDIRQGAYQRLQSNPDLPLERLFGPQESVAIDSVPGLRSSLLSEQRELIAGRTVITRPETYDMLSTLTPEQLANYDITQHYADLSPSDRLFWEGRKKDAANPDKQAQFASEQDQLNVAMVARLKIPAGNKGAIRRGEFLRAYHEEVRAFVAQNKEKPDAEQRQAIIERLLLPAARKIVFGMTKEIPLYQADPEKGDRVVVPERDRELIIEAYRKVYGRDPSDPEIEKEFIKNVR